MVSGRAHRGIACWHNVSFVAVEQHAVSSSVLTPAEVLTFWFAAPVDEVTAMEARMKTLFTVDPMFDAKVRMHCGATVEQALAGELDAWSLDVRGLLALVILLDQMPRNIHRGTARAFAGDARACRHALSGLARGWDRELSIVERIFLHLPLEHAEDLALQARCVAGYEALHAAAPPAWRGLTAASLQAGRDHHAVIACFGRFPHRNAALGRDTTSAEAAWLAEHPHGWGQAPADCPA